MDDSRTFGGGTTRQCQGLGALADTRTLVSFDQYAAAAEAKGKKSYAQQVTDQLVARYPPH